MAIDEEALHHSEETRRSGASSDDNRRHNKIVPDAPMSGRLPVKTPETQKAQIPPPRLLHPFLHNVPMHVRFGINGFLNNVLFMVAYNTAVVQFDGLAPPSTIYSIVYLIFIPVGHACISLLVFGWPERYVPSLMSNAPVGLTAIAIGAALTGYLDRMEFNGYVVNLVAQNWNYLGYAVTPTPEEEKGEFYSSLVVLVITGIWTFVLSVVINSPSEPSDKKEQ
mmetsp:Transcript_37766/g.58487  ORF Transcript_37766/g.58487 Transcript_37766/m.58487 type:complete len:223 (+) Transcript_37766:39-707(+)|eukprot:CAMPEP_0117005678 /NCGR_PEP_ID=MMETSP0472-20121206/6199_1 /TAXON_ID=693140 ORGANISM="Tiarina fusus, Strain LIS" /NCGR_SAMPLE_ID=MMETSP0472 /ASSEMBLY_ACC=CAM_ASM_000603 /LENGTH=222 /DNA_ID=CAMNT_0004706969 /DNA_START=36 /DNA_END=704 /DNA_ORIENTATION=-